MSTFILALTGHLIGDFLLQTKTMVHNKRHLGWLAGHCLIVTLVTMVLIGRPIPLHQRLVDLQFALAIWTTHLLIDTLKTRWMGEGWRSFLADQVLHVIAIATIVFKFGNLAVDGYWAQSFGINPILVRCALVVSGYLLCCPFGGYLIGQLTRGLSPESSAEGIAGAGQTIGLLERAIVMTLVMAGELSGIGFLITAKSILRFGDHTRRSDTSDTESRDDNRRASEYIIIGTFLSFGWALAIALLTRHMLTLNLSP